jgi:hypothetical protein
MLDFEFRTRLLIKRIRKNFHDSRIRLLIKEK